MFSFVGNVIVNNGAKFLADFFAVVFGSIGHVVKNFLMSIFVFIWNFISQYFWFICKYILAAIDFFQLAFSRILGINLTDGTSLSLADYIDGMKNITVAGGSNYYDYILRIFRAVFGVAIVLMIVFTIVAMIMQEYNLAVTGYQKADNNKGKFIVTIFKNIVSIFLIPLIFYTIIIGTNSILTSFYRALGGYGDTTVAGNVLAAATYDANRYRAYANANKRIPITISVYSADNAFGIPKSDEELSKEIQDEDVQKQLKAIAGAFANDSFLPFERSTIYDNGLWSNYKNYSMTYDNTVYDDMGQYFENFICTREQYYVLADFIDYCQLHNVKYYIKAISESDICWKYVDRISYTSNPDGTANGDVFLDVTYRDAEKVNSPSEIVDYASAAAPGSDNEFKTLQLTTKLDMTSPIADALKTASTLLGINEKDSSFNVMERDDSGDFVNLVQWANRKTLLKLSSGFSLTDPDDWTFSDQIIVYEYFRFQNDYGASNNVLEDYTIDDLKTRGALIDTLEMTYRNYNSNTETYSDEKKQVCVRLNGNYYRVVESTTAFDEYGHAYFELDVKDPYTNYFEDVTITIEKIDDVELKLSEDFDINDTSKWTASDEVLIYEYFKDLSLSNGLRRSYQFTDFNHDSAKSTKFPFYLINGTTYYMFINGTYYQCSSSGVLDFNVSHFLKSTDSVGERWFGYKLGSVAEARYGIDELYNLVLTFAPAPAPQPNVVDVEQSDAMFQKYSSINMKLSEGFSFYNTDTWTFRDYAIIFMYINDFTFANSKTENVSVQSLQSIGITGDIVRIENNYYLRVRLKVTPNAGTTHDEIVYIDLEKFEKTSEQKITTTISSNQFNELSLGSAGAQFIEYFNKSTDILLQKEVSSKFFELSENFDQYDPRTWSIGDYLMLYLIDKSYINTNIELIKNEGYTALCYDAGSYGLYYRFGHDQNAFFLNEGLINYIGYTVEKWFKTNLISFLLSARYKDLSPNDLSVGRDFADGTVADAESYLLKIDSEFANSGNLQYALAEDFLNYSGTFTDMSDIAYSYYNPKLVADDLLTWNYIDTIIYILTGHVTTKENPFISYLYKHSDDNIYLQIVDQNGTNRYVPINDDAVANTKCFYDASNVLLTQKIVSDRTKVFVGNNAKVQFNDYYTARFKSMVVELDDSTILNDPDQSDKREELFGDDGVLSQTVSSIYYTPYYNQTYWKATDEEWDLDGTGIGSGFIKNAVMNEFDIILASLGVAVDPDDGYFTFETYKQDSTGNIYVKVDEKHYIKLSTSSDNVIYLQSRTLSPNQGSAFILEGSDYVPNAYNYNAYDAVLYSVDNTFVTSGKTVTYKKYVCNVFSAADAEKTYLNVNGNIVKFVQGLTNSSYNLGIGEALSTEKRLFLYNTYYKQFVSNIAPTAKAVYDFSGNYSMLNFEINASLISSYSGLSLILQTLGVTNLRDNGCKIIEGINSYYLKFNTLYINLSELGLEGNPIIKDSSGSLNEIRIKMASSYIEDFRWVLAKVTSSGIPASPYKFLEPSMINEGTINSSFVPDIASSTYVDVSSDRVVIADSEVTDAKILSWTWLGLISSYVNPSSAETVQKYFHYDNGVGKVYYLFKNASSTYVVPYEFIGEEIYNLSQKIASDVVPVNADYTYSKTDLNLTGSTKLKLILSNLGFNEINAVRKFQSNYFMEAGNSVNNFYIFSRTEGLTDKYYAIYDLRGAEELVSGSGVQYIKYNGTDFNLTATESEGTNFVVSAKALSELTDWSMIDFVISYATNSIYETVFTSKVYVYNEQYYVRYNDQFILMPHLLEGYNGADDLFVENAGVFSLKAESDAKILDLLMFDDYDYNIIEEQYSGDFHKPLYQRSKILSGAEINLKTRLQTFDTQLIHNENLERGQVKFSNTFKLNNFESWTLSDYAIYYAFTQGYYTGSETEMAVFSYVPTFTKNGEVYYGLTYLDIVLAKIIGDNYLIHPSAQKFVLYHDANFNYYLKYISGSHYLPISAEISIDFNTMEVTSSKLDNLTASGVSAKKTEFTQNTPTKYYHGTTLDGGVPYYNYFSEINFQTFANANYAPVGISYLLESDLNTGSVRTSKVLNFDYEGRPIGDTRVLINYNAFYELYNDYLVSYLMVDNAYELEVKISDTELNNAEVTHGMKIRMVFDQVYPDLEFNDYYYFNLSTEKLLLSKLMSVPNDMQSAIKTGDLSATALQRVSVNLRLSDIDVNNDDHFDISSISNWRILDFIILYEFSRDKVRHNAFKGMTVEELFTSDYYYAAYYEDTDADDEKSENDKVYLYLNNNFYDISKSVVWSDDKKVFVSNNTTISSDKYDNGTGTEVDISGLVTAGDINNFNFKVLYQTLELSINPSYSGSAVYTRHKDNISYQVGNVTYFKELDMNVVDTNYRINVSLLGTYKVKELIKKTSWVEKLMTDMQVYYPDLNWGVLLATDGWLDTLGEFSSAHVNGLFVGGQNSSNTTAAGLVLSEFFMSVATKVDNGIAEYEYSSVFDKETIRALMMSLLGEENYQALVFEAEVFMDYFNSCFAPIIDDFAAEFGEDIGQSSLRLNAYKSYLATLLLSSDIGAFLYTIATRVYAEYTIGEYLAGAAGDYSGYYSYVNQLTDDEGNIVDAFSYGSFVELLLYENEYCGTTNPVFTYNFKKAFDKYKDGEGKYLNRTYEELVADEVFYKVAAREFFNNIDKDHERIYNAGYQISEQGIVVNDEGEEVSFYSGNTYIYCYMLHVYWEIRTEVSSFNIPSYLKCYRYYLDGSLTRWDIIKNENIETADQYFEHYESEKGKIALYKRLSLLSTYRLFMPGVTLDDGSDAMLLEILKLFAELVTNPTKLANNISIPIVNVLNIFKDAQLKKDVDFVFKKSLGLYFTMGFSEDSSFKVIELLKDVMDDLLPLDLSTEACWNTILEYYDALERIINELKRVRELLPGEMTERGSSRLISEIIAGDDKYYTDAQLDFITSAFVGLSNNVNQYILAQKRIDQMQKRSITFAMAQYGANYVTTGFEFSVKNKVYMFKPTTDPLRLAEYVMGGAFLESVGEGAKYTDPEFTGIIKASKVYDNVDHTLKTQLDSWSELRRFLSKIADQTAELYFTTNLADLDVEKNNAIKIDDPIQMEGTYSGDSIQESLYYYIANGIDRKILYRLLNQPYNAAAIPNYNNDPKKFVAVAQYILEREVSEDEFEGMTFEQFKRLAMKKIIDNEQNQDETPEERSAKYMVLFNILGMQVDLRADTLELDRVLNSAQVDKEAAVYVQYKENGFTISGKLRMSDNTLETIKVLSGLENRPTREVLIRQYEGIRPGDYYDEAFGDTFIACTYKNGLYYPVLGSASRSVKNNPKYSSYVADEILRTNFISQYYDNNSNVVVMKGIITANGYPTAIRKYNNPVEILKKQLFNTTSEEYNAVTYYRTDVGANFGSGKDLIDSSRAVPRVTTKNYTQYVYGTNYTKGIGSSVTYTGKTNLKTVVSSDYSGRFVQARSEYLMGQADDLGGISVLDDFSYFYVFGGQSWALLVLAFVTIIPVMINACGGAAARILDIIVLFIISPVIISTNSLYPEGKNSTYKKWRENLEGVAMGAFGYIIAFASFSLLIPMVYSVNSYVSVATYNKIVSIGGIGGFFTYPMVNSLVKCLWVITVVSVLERMPKLLLPIITANRGNLNSPHPGLGAGMGQEFTAKAKNVIGEVKGEFKKVASVVSGQALLGMVATAKEELTNMIPGYTELKMVANTVKGAAHKIKQDAMAAAIEKALMAYGFDAATAKAMGNAVKEADKANQKAKKEQQEKMKQYGKQFKEMI